MSDAYKVQIEVAGSVYIPYRIADIDHALYGWCLRFYDFDGFGEDFLAGVFVVGAAHPKVLAGNAHVLHFDFSRLFPAAGGYGYGEGWMLEELRDGSGCSRYFLVVVGVLAAQGTQSFAIELFEGNDFCWVYWPLEMIGDDFCKDGGVAYMGVLPPVDGREGFAIEVGVGLGEAAGVAALGIDEGAVYVEEDEGHVY